MMEMRRVAANLPYNLIDTVAAELLKAGQADQSIFLFGNGGSAALASHFACDLGKGTCQGNNGKRFRVLALTDNIPTMTAWANDSCYEDIFAEPLKNLMRRDDVAFAISGSGNSKNVLKALQVAREAGAVTLGFSGFQGGQMKALCDLCVVVPSDNMQIIEDLHLAMAHSIFLSCRRSMTPKALAAVHGSK